MAKKAILEVLESTIGKYVHNLDSESLNVAVWSGKIELQSLQLDVHAVNSELSRRAILAPNLACPFKVIEGRFDKVQLDVPWARLTSRPVVFRASGLWVYVEPHDFLAEARNNPNGYTENRYGTKMKSRKSVMQQQQKVQGSKEGVMEERINSIATAEEGRRRMSAMKNFAWDSEDVGDTNTTSSSSSNNTFTTRLVRRIIENLQVEIQDVHIAIRGCQTAAGIVLGSLSLSTTDAKGNKTFVDRSSASSSSASAMNHHEQVTLSFLYKELLISGFGIYLQRDNEDNNSNGGTLKQRLARISTNTEYILEPLSFQAKLRQSDLDTCIDFPKYLVHSKLSSLSITVSRNQLELGHQLAMAVVTSQPNSTTTEIRPLFPEYRPLVPVKGNAHKWWKYAVRCIGRLNQTEAVFELHKRNVYSERRDKKGVVTSSPWLSKLRIEERVELENIERDRSISILGLMHWRNIADAQFVKEKEKYHRIGTVSGSSGGSSISSNAGKKKSSKKSSSFAKTKSSVFGSPAPKRTSSSLSQQDSLGTSELYQELTDDGNNDDDEDDIALTTDEMRELEKNLAMTTIDSTLSKDSMFCDINFTLGSFHVNLVKGPKQPLTSLEMGMVSASFKANADGSFTSGLTVLSLEVLDGVTPATFYPTVCRSLQKGAHSNTSHAFRFQLKKSKVGDQELVLKMVACEIVASPMLLFAVREFFKLPPLTAKYNGNDSNINPYLYQSSSGDEDLFFDAKGGESTVLMPPAVTRNTTTKPQFDFSTHAVALKDGRVSDKVSSAIMDAWNGKNKNRQKWRMDFDISAPILILPENCTDPNATVLICNFGRFNFRYGTDALSSSVTQWFNDRQRPHKMDSEVDHLKLEMNDLFFTISSVGVAKDGLDGANTDVSGSVIQPISFTLDVGLEHTISAGDETPRTCVIGVLPAIILRLAPSHITKMLSVAAIWTSNLHKLRGDVPNDSSQAKLTNVPEELVDEDPDIEIMSSGSGISILDGGDEDEENGAVRTESLLSKKDRLESLILSRQNTDSSTGIEFMHVSVSLLRLSINVYTENGDGLEAHLVSVMASSSLATDGTSSTKLAMGWFWILDQLDSELKLPRRQRLLCHSICRDQLLIMPLMTTELADIHILKLPENKAKSYHDQVSDFSRDYIQSIHEVDKVTVVNAKFTSLFINWNPQAIKTLLLAKNDLTGFKEEAMTTYGQMSMLQQKDGHKTDVRLHTATSKTEKVNSVFILAQMDMNDDNSEMTFTLGDFRMVTPDYSNTLEPYQVLLGLAPSVATSLLTFVPATLEVQTNRNAKLVLNSAVADECGVNSGGSCNEVAKSSQSGQKLFYIVASGFDLVLPQAAYSENYFLFHAGNFQAHYRAFENDVGSEAQVSLKDVSMRCGRNMTMVSTPVNLSVKVQMKPPFAKGTEEELATRIEMSTSRIRILVARCHYSQIMRTLDYNISEQNNFLRGDRSLQPKRAAQTDDKARKGTVDGILKSMGHAGVENVDVIKRMYINFNIQELSVELCGVDTDDPIVSLAAVNTHILTQLLPDEDVTKAYVTLHDLVCDDRRLGSVDRTFRRMIGKATSNRTDLQDSEVFVLNYTKYGADESRDIEVKLGSSQVVVLPDVISDLIAFVKVAPIQGRLETLAGTSVLGRSNEPSTKAVEMRYEESSGTEAVVLKKTKYHVESSNMRLVLVDIGSVDASGSFSSSKSASLTETIVVQEGGNEVNDETLQKDYKIDAERVEIYTAQGVDLLHPVQILEPAKFALFYYQDIGNDDSPHVTDIKFVTLSPIEVTFSMQNAALASALATSITDAFGNNDSVNESIDDEFHFPANDANRIARLESALDKDSAVSTAAPSEHGTDLSVHSGNKLSTKAKRRIIRLKSTMPEAATTVTNDFQGLDEALFKIVVMNCVAGGEIDYPSLTSDKPCFGCNMNTSVLADYFDAASCRWETLLVQPWEITFNASRGPQTRTNSKRMSTTFDIESNPCHVSFSEHFLVNVGAASRMWSVYSGATKQATTLVEERVKDNSSKRRLSRSMAAHAARSLITTLPYAIENHSGINASYSLYNDPTSFELPTSSTRFFRFELFPEKGSGGVRKYGQDIKHAKSLIIYVGSTKISVPDMDTEANMQTHVFTKVVKRGNSTVLHLSSHVEMHNKSSLPFRISIIGDESIHDLGVVQSSLDERKNGRHDDSKSLLKENEELMTHSVFGLPAPLLRNFATNSTETLCLQVSPILSDGSSGGDLVERLVSMASSSDGKRKIIEVTCSPSSREIRASSLTTHISFNVSLIDGDHAFIELSITPRAVLKNKLPVPVLVRTPMPHAFPTCEHTRKLNPLETIEVFTPGPSIAVSMKCADLPIGGTLTGWIDGEWIDVPLGKDKCLPEPSLDRYRTSRQIAVRGSGSRNVTPDLKGSLQKHHAAVAEDVRTVVSSRSINPSSLMGSPPFSAYSSAKHRRRVSLLPGSSNLIRLASLTMDGDEGMKKSVPFRVEDVSMTEGVDATPILWADSTPSGYFAYRNLTAEGSELHVVPEYVIFNGSTHHQICVRQISQPPFLLDPSKISPISRDRNNSIVVQFEIPAINGLTGPVQIDRVGLRVCVAKSRETGEPLGSLAVQTVTGARDSRLVIKIGALNFKKSVIMTGRVGSLPKTALDAVAREKLSEARHDYNMEVGGRVEAQAISLPSSERAQFSVVIHNVRIMDCSPNSESPIVFDSMSDKNFIDLCVRTRGPLNADLIRVDLFDVNLPTARGKQRKSLSILERICLEDAGHFSPTMLATAELAGVDLDLRWDEEKGKFSVAISDPRLKDADDIDHDGNYKPPRSDKLYDVKKIRVSPFILLLSFKRQPQSSRYKLVRGGRGAKLTNYFTTRLKFTVTGADLRFKGYMGRDVKATSINDWKYLAARESGSEEFIEGDIFRVTGNLAGRSAKFVLKKSGDYIGDSLVAVTGVIGGEFKRQQNQLDWVNVVTGLGVGVSKSVKGIGSGAGDLLRGTGKGIGQAVGGIGGGVQLVAKGIGKGITTGDASAVGEGFATMGQGVGQGVETVVDGAVSGVMSVGKGLFSGVGSITKGIGGVFTPGGDSDKKVPPKNYQRRNR
ncbi:vacuolar protein sorting-associated protein 13 [Skeletonema marinoi]|uniref:Vacuolar protein sorting-associated protein 13 n=1 Tax=Skeletonema marinoi TaxID=267567 RepID=A0AAD8YD19_9STRA|nr:vacuolar protein sorting-associated protein 13 [Skeletonema marinoi]